MQVFPVLGSTTTTNKLKIVFPKSAFEKTMANNDAGKLN